MKSFLTIFIVALVMVIASHDARAACAATNLTWDGSSTTSWGTANNWTPANVPDTTTENAIIVSAPKNTQLGADFNVSCVTVSSGVFESKNTTARTLSIYGDYFSAPNLGTLSFASNHNITFSFLGTAAQTLTAVDPLNYVNLGGNSSLTITDDVTITRGVTFTGSTAGNLIIDSNTTFSFTSLFTIPSGITVTVNAGASLTLAGSMTVNGTLIMQPGSTLYMPAASTLTVSSSGVLQLNGSSGSVVTIRGVGSSTWNMSMAGTMTASYFRFDRLAGSATGLSITGIVSSMSNGEFHYIASAGSAMTWGAGATLPATMNNLGFFDDNAYGNNKSITATSYAGTAVTLNSWSGLGCTVEGCAYETDPSSKVTWGLQAGVSLTLSTNTNSGKPVNPTTSGATADEWVIFSFNLTSASTATDITQVILTSTGSATATDIEYIQVFKQGATCQTLGAQIGSNLTMSGSPAKATVTIPAATVTTDGTSAACIHVYVQTASTATNGVTLGIQIASSSDVTNSAGYAFSPGSSPPVSGGQATINGSSTRVWDGSNSTSWTTNPNWTGGGAPTTADNCRVGTGTNIVTLTASQGCQNMTLATGGTINFNSGAFILDVTGSLDVQSGYIFQNATSGTLRMSGTTAQSITLTTTFPGGLTINNSGGAVVATSGNVTVTGNLAVQAGTFRIANGHTVTISGNVTVSSGATLDIEPGGILKLGNNAVLTINSGGILEMIGTASLATVNATAPNAYTVVVNGTIKANNYTFSNLGTNGVTINSGATIDATNYLQNGTFTYPQNNNTQMLRLFTTIPGHTLSGMNFSMGGSSASAATIKNIATSVASGTNLSVTSFSGDLGGTTYESESGYIIDWAGEMNTYKVTVEASAPTNVYQGAVYTMGRLGFQQMPGALFNNMTVTSIKLTLLGTGTASDVTQVKIQRDNDCNGTSEADLRTGTFSGSPATVTLSGISFVVEAGASPPMRCLIIQFTMSASATGTKTVGAKVDIGADIVNDQSYTIDSSTPAPREMGTSTIISSSTSWTGTTSTDWATSTNWSSGVPTVETNCTVAAAANNPTLATGTGLCKTLTVTNGTLTISSGATLQLYGSLTSSGTVNNSGTIEFMDGGTTLSQSITCGTGTPGTIKLSGTASTSSTVTFVTTNITMNTLVFTAGTTHKLQITNGRTLTLPNGLSIPSGTLQIYGGGVLQIGNGQTLTVNGGTLRTDGIEEASPQTLTNKGKIKETSGTGTWTFSATSGTVYLSGFLLENLDTNGVQINGTTNLTRFHGGQFRNLSTSYASVKALQLNTTGTVPSVSTNVGWNWGPNNGYPANTDGYKIISTSGNGCSGGTIDFTGWFGDWYENTATFDVSTKVTQSNCTINMGASASPVSLLSLTATPYESSVDIYWETSLEQDHQGFNVYRANAVGAEFVQINGGLVRNLVGNTSTRGKYRFIDNDVIDGNTYFYYVEDIGSNGTHRELHGPIHATPEVGLGLPPAGAADVNQSTLADANYAPNPGAGAIVNPSYKDLGNGIVILSQSSTGLRLWIKPSAITYAASSWNASYQTMAANGHSSTDTSGHPQLLIRTLMIEVDPWTTQASLTSITKTESNQAGHPIAPAPAWNLVNDVLTPSYSIDAVAYASNTYLPANPVEVESSLYTQGNRKFLKVNIYPARYNAAQEIVKILTEAVVDIGLVGSAWDAVAPANDFTVAPEVVSGTLQMAFESSGVHQFSYDDLVDSSVDGPFVDVSTSALRLYFAGEEIPIKVTSADAIFNSGDTIRFYVDHFPSLDDRKNVVVLANRELVTTGMPVKRISQVDGNPTGVALSSDATVKLTASAEENYLDFFSDPLGTGLDHFFWKRIFAPYPAAPSFEYLDVPIVMNGHDSSGNMPVTLKVYLKGNRGSLSDMLYQHHLGIWVNNVATMAASADWIGENYQVLSFDLPASNFFHGTNTIRLKSLGTYALAGDWDVMLIDKVEVSYWGERMAKSNSVQFPNYDKDTVVSVKDFTSNDMIVYDTSSLYETFQIINGVVSSSNGNSTYDIAFNTVSAGNQDRARRYYVFTPATIKSPTAFIPSYGSGQLLKDNTRQADIIVIGPQNMLYAVQDWAAYREDQGLSVERVSLEQIYAEFNNGIASSYAIKEFVLHALDQWTTPAAQYLLLLGDATYDPKDHLGYVPTNVLWPMPIVEGRFYDFGSDNWLVSSYTSIMPRLAVGRLPFTNASDVAIYLEKVIDYENGDKAPASTTSKELVFISDSDTAENEDFLPKAQSMAALTALSDNGLTTTTVFRGDYANNALFNAKFIDLFEQTPLLMTFIGHGAEDRMAHIGVFSNTHAEALTNTRLPIVMALNCLNAGFYNADPSIITLSETLLANPDGGAIAFIGSTSMTTPSAQMNYANEFFNSTGAKLGQASYELRLGDIFIEAKNALSPTSYNADVIESYTLIGDPTLQIPSSSFTPKPLPVTAPSPLSDIRPSAASSGGGGCSLGAAEGDVTADRVPWQALEWPLWFACLFILRRLTNFRVKRSG